MKDLTIIKPDDWHLHLREGVILKNIIKYTSEIYGRAVVMPNIKSPITTVDRAILYKKSITESLTNDSEFKPLLTLYLTDETSKNELILQSFYPNKLSFLLSSIICAAFSAVFFHLIQNPGSYSGSYRAEFWNNLPIEIQYLIFLLLILSTIVLLLPLLFPSTS